MEQVNGNVGIVVSGGNVSRGTLADLNTTA
jgi:hypothetical protein